MDRLWKIACILAAVYSAKAQDKGKDDGNNAQNAITKNRNLQIRHACWDSRGPPVLSAQCPRDTAIHVTRAGLKMANHVGRYDKCVFNEDDCGCLYGEAGCNMSDPRKACMGTPACRLDVTVQYIRTEKCSGFTNYMFVEFECVPIGKISIESICSNTEADAEFGYIKGPGALSVDGRTQCDCTLTTSPYSEMSVTMLDYHSGSYSCSQEQLVVQYGRNAQQFCADRYEGGQKISAGVNKVSLTFTTEGRKDAGGFWLKFKAEPQAAIKVQCAYSVEPRSIQEKTTKKISDPIPRNPTTIPTIEPTEPEVVDLEPESTQVYDNPGLVSTEEPPQKLNDDSTKTPWWWRFTLKGRARNGDDSTTTFPPWFKEVDATEFPAWIKKTVTPSDRVQKESFRKKIRLIENNKRQEQKRLETENRLRAENKIDKNLNTKDLVHGNIHSDQQREIQISRNFRLPQRNVPGQYNAVRQQGKFKKKRKSHSSKTYSKRSNFTLPVKRPTFRANTRKTKTPNNVHEVVYTFEPTSNPNYETTTQTSKYKRPHESKGKITVIEIEEIEEPNSLSKSEENVNPVRRVQKVSPKVTARINRQREFLNKVRKQKNMWKRLRAKKIRSEGPTNLNRDKLPQREKPLYSHEDDNTQDDPDMHDNRDNDVTRTGPNYEILENHYSESDNKVADDNFGEYRSILDEIDRPKRIDIDKDDTEYENGTPQETGFPLNEINHEPQPEEIPFERKKILPRFNGYRKKLTKRRKKGDLRDSEHFPTMTPDMGNIDLLPNSRVTQIADFFRHSTVHTSDLAKMFESKKTQLTVLEPTHPPRSTKTKPFLTNSRSVLDLYDSENSDHNFPTNPSPSTPHFSLNFLSTATTKPATKESTKSAKNKTRGSESLAARSRGTGDLAKLPGAPYSGENVIRGGESITVTIIAACVIGSILLIVIIGIVVRFVINRADPNHSIRQHHKKECIVRRNQRERGKSYA